MKKYIEIGDKMLEFEATAMTDHMVDHLFGVNVAYQVQHADENKDKMPDLIKRIAFVMNKRAELGGWRAVEALSEEEYYDWLDGVDSYGIETNAQELMSLYARNKLTTVSPKNTKSPQAEW